MSRYAEPLAAFARRLGSVRRGWCLVQCVAGEQVEVAACLSRLLGLPLAAVSDDLEPFSECVVHLVPQQAAPLRDAALSSINGRRDRLSDRGRWILVASRSELAPLQRYAADIFSVLQAVEEVPLVPRQLSIDEEEEARRQLADWYHQRLGKLDLRGFIRSETEDASFLVEEIFQPLEATVQGHEGEWAQPDQGPEVQVQEVPERAPARGDLIYYGALSAPLLELVAQTSGPALILGSPGAGKSFFLRWCALKASAMTRQDPALFGIVEPLPVLLSLAAVGLMPGLPSLEDYAVEWLLSEGLLAGHLLAAAAMQGRALFLLDGLDEVGDAAARGRALEAVVALTKRFPRARILATSRPGGLAELDEHALEPLGARRLAISPLSEPAIHTLLVRWCELYELHREGTEVARRRGHERGEALASQVLASAPVRELAASPLLATVIAIIHRAGVRLPDRRVELYEHALKILVERWNAARTRGGQAAVPLRLPDAIRLLGPVALEMIERDREGAIDERSLQSMLERALAAGNVRGVTDAAASLELFRSSLGLLVERAPGIYGFLHQTFVEFLAAHELVRTGKLLALVKSPRQAYEPKWHEVILLGAGILGVLQANDEGLGALVGALVTSAQRRRGRPSPEVPRLLGELLADDPALSTELAQQLVDELVPKWWFERSYGRSAIHEVVREGVASLERIAAGPWRSVTGKRFSRCHREVVESIVALDLPVPRFLVLRSLDSLGVEVGGLVCEVVLQTDYRRPGFLIQWYTNVIGANESLMIKEGTGWRSRATVRLSPGMLILWDHTWDSGLWRLFPGDEATCLFTTYAIVSRSQREDTIQLEYVASARCPARMFGIVVRPTTEDVLWKVRAAHREILALPATD